MLFVEQSDFYPLYLGNHIFGGSGLTAILSDEIREKKGLAYSVYSHFSKRIKIRVGAINARLPD
jgi:predicted Zn-dependent peptidase